MAVWTWRVAAATAAAVSLLVMPGTPALSASQEGPPDPAAATADRAGFTVSAFGDSIASGWGYYGENGEMTSITRLSACKPGDAPADNGCSANSPGRRVNSGEPQFLTDYGYANGIAWPAQVARRLGVPASGFTNVAVAGAMPVDWKAGGAYRPLLQRVWAEDPDLLLMTLGANPLLSQILLGDGAKCAFRNTDRMMECVREFIDAQQVERNVADVIGASLRHTTGDLVVTQYHSAVPALSTFRYYESEWILQQVNKEIERAVQRARDAVTPAQSRRLFLMTPRRFDTGMPRRDVHGRKIDGGGSYHCGATRLTKVRVDGPSRQAEVSQLTMRALNPLEFCGASYLSGDSSPWTVEGDLGIHLSKAGAGVFADGVLSLPIRRPGQDFSVRCAATRAAAMAGSHRVAPRCIRGVDVRYRHRTAVIRWRQVSGVTYESRRGGTAWRPADRAVRVRVPDTGRAAVWLRPVAAGCDCRGPALRVRLELPQRP